MKSKPESWRNLPNAVLDLWLSNYVELDYEPYESSRAEVHHHVLCGNVTSRNEDIIQEAYKNLSLETLETVTKNVLQDLERQLEVVKNFLTTHQV
jgi:hypothetical protein